MVCISKEIKKCKAIRFIPACAGNRVLQGKALPLPPVHPRLCGEQFKLGTSKTQTSGSSPLVRGTGYCRKCHRRLNRFIPACVGNSIFFSLFQTIQTVHPRLCGEQRSSLMGNTETAGSSPLVRGTAKSRQACRMFRRFIPACAGNSKGIYNL